MTKIEIYSTLYFNIYEYLMPEGPEITVIASQLCSLMHGKFLHEINILAGPYFSSKVDQYATARRRLQALNKKSGITFDSVHKHGKFIYFLLKYNNKEIVIGNTLGLTGEWHLVSDPDTSTQKLYPKIQIVFGDTPTSQARQLIFSDKLSMGRFWVESRPWLLTKLGDLGPDVADPNFAFNSLTCSKPIYMALVDQTFISGIGNYLRAEILGEASIDPFMSFKDLTKQQKKHLEQIIIRVVQDVIRHGGVSESDRVSYRDIFGTPGRYKVQYYKQTIAPDGRTIKSIKDPDNRVFYYVE
jgi:formamidopyrimidine-DNA glycosylase